MYLENIKEPHLGHKTGSRGTVQIDDWKYIHSSLLWLQETINFKTFSSSFPI